MKKINRQNPALATFVVLLFATSFVACAFPQQPDKQEAQQTLKATISGEVVLLDAGLVKTPIPIETSQILRIAYTVEAINRSFSIVIGPNRGETAPARATLDITDKYEPKVFLERGFACATVTSIKQGEGDAAGPWYCPIVQTVRVIATGCGTTFAVQVTTDYDRVFLCEGEQVTAYTTSNPDVKETLEEAEANTHFLLGDDANPISKKTSADDDYAQQAHEWIKSLCCTDHEDIK